MSAELVNLFSKSIFMEKLKTNVERTLAMFDIDLNPVHLISNTQTKACGRRSYPASTKYKTSA